MTDRLLHPTRRRLLAAGAAGLVLPGAARAQSLLAPQPTAPAAAPAAPAAAGAGTGSAVIDVDRARASPIPIAIPSFPGDAQLGQNIAGVITNDLANCGLFRPISPAAFINAGATGAVPDFQNWKAIGAQALVTGQAATLGGGQIQVQFRLWDVLPQTQIQGTAYTTAASNWRRVGHMIADVIYERLLGEGGYFDTRIVYVAGSGPRNNRIMRLAIMDQDSENNRFLTDGRYLALTPRFHPKLDEIAFMSYVNDRPRVYLFNLGTGRQRVLGDFQGITLSPRFSPDGSTVIMAQTTPSGGSRIVTVALNGSASHALTDGSAIDVSPCYSPDGTQIVFNSDRGGDQQLYVMAANGSGVKRISFGGARYGDPVWSPRGDLIAFTRIGGSTFGIGVMHPDGSGERILSESYFCEGPTFAPNGRVIMFWKQTPARNASGAGYSTHLYSVDITGFNERAVVTPTDGSDPAWSPLGG